MVVYIYLCIQFTRIFPEKTKTVLKTILLPDVVFQKEFFSSYPFDTCVFVRIHTNMCSAILLLSKSYNVLLYVVYMELFLKIRVAP